MHYFNSLPALPMLSLKNSCTHRQVTQHGSLLVDISTPKRLEHQNWEKAAIRLTASPPPLSIRHLTANRRRQNHFRYAGRTAQRRSANFNRIHDACFLHIFILTAGNIIALPSGKFFNRFYPPNLTHFGPAFSRKSSTQRSAHGFLLSV